MYLKHMYFINLQIRGKHNCLLHPEDNIKYIWLKWYSCLIQANANVICFNYSVQFSSVAQLSDSLQLQELQHARPPCPSPTAGVHSNSCPSRWCHPAISSSVVTFSSCPQSLPASGSFPMSQLFTWAGQSTGVSAWTITSFEIEPKIRQSCNKTQFSFLA